jgi:hypothetical protein
VTGRTENLAGSLAAARAQSAPAGERAAERTVRIAPVAPPPQQPAAPRRPPGRIVVQVPVPVQAPAQNATGGRSRIVLQLLSMVPVFVMVGAAIYFWRSYAVPSSGGNAPSETCSTAAVNAQGFSQCLLDFAKPVADKGNCRTDESRQTVPGQVVRVACTTGEYTVRYVQWATSGNVRGETVKLEGERNMTLGDWSGGGRSGKVYTHTVGGAATLFFTDTNPGVLSGEVSKADPKAPQPTAQQLVDFFEKNVKPGT